MTSPVGAAGALGSNREPERRRSLGPAACLAGLVVCPLGLGVVLRLVLRELNHCTTLVGMNWGTAVEMYASDNCGEYPESPAKLLEGNYLRTLPTCPAAHRVSYHYERSRGPEAFTVTCRGNHHWLGLGVERTRDGPAYSSHFGTSPGGF